MSTLFLATPFSLLSAAMCSHSEQAICGLEARSLHELTLATTLLTHILTAGC